MADYFSPTVLQPMIPITDMTCLERLLLMQIFRADIQGDLLYLYADERPADLVTIRGAELEAALASPAEADNTAARHVTEQLPNLHAGDGWVDLDLSGTSWEFIIRYIVRRSSCLRYVAALTAFTCSKMRPDGFGGMATLITANAIRGKSTSDLLAELLSEAGLEP